MRRSQKPMRIKRAVWKEKMNKVDFSNYKFRASGLVNLMTNSRTKSDPLGESTKTYLRDIFIKEVYGREKLDIKTKYTDKGIACESDSLDLVQKVTKKTYFKNKSGLENEWVKGTPDIIIPKDHIKDIKTSWDIWTFAKVDAKVASDTYFYQLFAYMWLTETERAELLYCLVNTPEEIIQGEAYRASFQFPEIGESDEAMAKFRKNYLFDDIPVKVRIKNFWFEYSEEEVEKVKNKVVLAREYLAQLHL